MVPPAREIAATMTATATQAPQKITVITKLGKHLATVLILVTDYNAVVLAMIAAWYMRATILPLVFPNLSLFSIDSIYIFCVVPLCYICFLAYEGMYSRRLPLWQDAEYLFKISTYVTGLVVAVTYFTGDAGNVSRIFIFETWIFSFILLVLSRYCTKRVLSICGLWQKPVVIVGAGKTAELLVNSFSNDPHIGYKIVGLIEDNYDGSPLVHHYPYIGNFAHAEQAILSSGVEDVIIAAPGLDREQLMEMVYRIQPYVRNLIIVPNLFGFPLSNLRAQTLFNEKIMLLSIRNNMTIGYNRFLKRVFDLVCSTLGTVMILPLLVAIAIAIYVDSPGQVFFAHNRIGTKGSLFPCYKFRSMIPDAQKVLDEYLKQNPSAREEWQCDFKLKDDPRITAVGRFLRKTSLDELPQLMNVIKGEMSLVGPRPIVDKEVPKYGEYINDYFMVRPGITGIWQVSGRSDVDYDSRVQMDSWYVRNWSVWMDIVLLCKTVKAVLVGRGAY